uniref:Coiled-coil domain containing 32 n=1 Tax=Eptatretus burgeri TaxID=7764 RepID=A0A8C4R728_EPTBU
MAEVSSNNGNPESYSLPSDVDPWKPIFGEFQSEGTCTTSSQGFDNNFADSFSENLCVHVQNGSQTQQHCPLPDSEVYLASLERRLQKIKGRSRNLTSHDLISGLERVRQDCLAELLGHTDDSEPFYEEDIDGALIQLRRRLQPESVALSAEELQYLLHARKSSSSSLGDESSGSDDAADS